MKYKRVTGLIKKKRIIALGLLLAIAVTFGILATHNSSDNAQHSNTGQEQSPKTDKSKIPAVTTDESSANPTAAPVQSTATQPQCDNNARKLYENAYNTKVKTENDTHQQNRQNITDAYDPSDISSRSNYQRALIEEDNRHQAALADIDNNYKQQLKDSNC
jgi:cytoskeletal protein RodZ